MTSAAFQAQNTIQKTYNVIRVREFDGDRVPKRDFLDTNENGVADSVEVRLQDEGYSLTPMASSYVQKFEELSLKDGTVDGLKQQAKQADTEVVLLGDDDDVWLQNASLDYKDWYTKNRTTLGEMAEWDRDRSSKVETGLAYDAKMNQFLIFEK